MNNNICRYKNCKNLIDHYQRKKDGLSSNFSSLEYCFGHKGCEYWSEYYEMLLKIKYDSAISKEKGKLF